MGETTIRNSRRKKNVATTLADWSTLHQDFINCFAHQVVSMKDFFAFGGVSKSWRSAIKENSNTALRLQHKVPVLILSKEINAPVRNIYSLTECQISQLDLPETKGKLCYSSLGWLLTVSQDYSTLDLFNPLTHAHIELPPPLPPKKFSLRNLKRFVLSSSPSFTSDYGVMLLSYHHLAFYKPGYNNGTWTLGPIPLPEPLALVDAVYYKGQFYVVDYRGKVFVCKIEDPNDAAQMRLVAPEIPEQLFGEDIHFIARYLVESATGTLNSWAKSEVKNLGNTTLFVGANNSSFWIEPLDDSVCKANCIYFLNRSHVSTADDIDIGIYHMKDGKMDKHLEELPDFKYKGSSLTSHSWLQPSF
ncbi:hypothetical protein ACLB2K_069758 [Fragaria x ananassa]